ncbi:Tetraspanin 74F [Schistosoma japonicum]|nr:Tetraspanin 74F [Schistosoma japonicum]KAH8872012.1 Tetraspanin 74F [Schistosoma japonicum]
MYRKYLSGRTVALILFVLNGISILFGITLISLGIVYIVDHGNMFEVVGSSLYTSGVYMLIFLGLVITIIALCGYIAADRENICLIVSYIFILGLLALLLFISGIMVLSFRSSLGDSSKNLMIDSLRSHYGRHGIITDAWNLVQRNLRCCGVDDSGWSIYNGSWWDMIVNSDLYETNTKLSESSLFYLFVPESCCAKKLDGLTGWPTDIYRDKKRCQTWQYGPPNKRNGPHNDAIYYAGCFESLRSYINNYAKPLGILALIACVILISALICALFLYRDAKLNAHRKQRTINRKSHS